ncbi:hypothetical protein [Bacillus cereus group sp. BfR-BA-01380]|uniref:hypothetical protein n=1 Tax=Bacillus cereus group sp. BfR-BA-01380 TaxID=2920324 RepID=UPI001F5AF02B|nr:hypothetical protein [Bacillus cereus group sp. BfR-BA-01380]
MPGPLLLSVIILSCLMIGLTFYFHQEDSEQDTIQDKVRLVFPIFILTIAISFALAENNYVAIFSWLFMTVLLFIILYAVMKDYLQK